VAVFEPEAELAILDAEETGGDIVGRSPWALAGRRLLHNKLALAALALFLLIVAVSLAAPLYAHHVSHTDPFQPNISGSFKENGKTVQVIQQGTGKLGLGETPVGPTWKSHYFVGADNQGRDVMARVLYGGRASLEIGVGSALLACLLAGVFALIAGFFGGWTDSVLSRLMDLIWSFPLYLLAISLATVLLTAPNGLNLGFVHIGAASYWVPLLIIGFVYVPYVFRPIRGQVLSLREKEFVEAAIAQGASNFRIVFREILPNVLSTVIVLLPLMIATTILTESALSYL
jgi:peptide/nickel transport system permease protein